MTWGITESQSAIFAEKWFRENAQRFRGSLKFQVPLKDHTYYRIGGPADFFFVPKDLEDLKLLAQAIQVTQVPYFILGSGSNVLVDDRGFRGLIIRTHKLNLKTEVMSKATAHAKLEVCTGTSVAVSTLLNRAVTEGWDGFEFLTGVPGSMGGVVWMNAGTHLGEAKDHLLAVSVFDLQNSQFFEYKDNSLNYKYRKNLFLSPHHVIFDCKWQVQMANKETVRAKIEEILKRRKATQPLDHPSCGSVFKNPEKGGLRAWQVIDRLGLRGHRIGDAEFSEKHSNFIVNLGQAKSADVINLLSLAKERALKELGITLEEEVIFLDCNQ